MPIVPTLRFESSYCHTCAGAQRAGRVMINGRWVVENCEIVGLDIDDIIRRHGAAAKAVQGG
jgi:8-oxoguanine deaminase